MNDRTTVAETYINAGGLLMFSSGEYSDYGTDGCFVALETLTRTMLRELAEQVTADHKRAVEQHDVDSAAWEASGRVGEHPSWPEDPQGMFVSASIRKGWLLALTYTNLHIGSYGRVELSL